MVGLLGMVLILASVAWRNLRGKADVTATARIVKSCITRARMLAVYRGQDHFVVLDPDARTIAIYRDSHEPTDAFDSGDERVGFEPLPGSGSLKLPAHVGTLDSPFGGRTLSEAWSVPGPNPTGAWGTTLRGFAANTEGQLVSAESTPTPILSGVMVFSDRSGQTSAVGVRGQAGNVRAFQLDRSGWLEL